MELSAVRLFSDNVVIKLSTRVWSNRIERADDADGKKGLWIRFVSSDELKKIHAKVRNARTILGKQYGTPFDWGTGLYLVRKVSLVKALEALRDVDYEFADEVDAFLDAFPAALQTTVSNLEAERDKANAEDRLGDAERAEAQLKLLDLAPPVDTMFRKFGIDFTTFSIGVPEETGDAEIDELVKTQFTDTLDLSFGGISERLYAEFEDLLKTLADAMTDPNRKKFYSTLTTNITDWIENFEHRNFLSDETLEGVVNEVATVIDGVDIDKLRKSHEERGVVGVNIKALLKKLKAAEKPERTVIL